jgi:hypothetical protein
VSVGERDPRKLIPPLHRALLKNEQDVHLFERLAFLSQKGSVRRGGQFPSLRAQRSNPSSPQTQYGLLRRFAPRNDEKSAIRMTR